MPRIVEPWYESKLRWTAMPPDSANAIASFIARRSKYFSRIRTDRTVRAHLARPLRVLRSELEAAGRDLLGRRDNAPFDEPVVWKHIVHLSTTQVEEDQA